MRPVSLPISSLSLPDWIAQRAYAATRCMDLKSDKPLNGRDHLMDRPIEAGIMIVNRLHVDAASLVDRQQGISPGTDYPNSHRMLVTTDVDLRS